MARRPKEKLIEASRKRKLVTKETESFYVRRWVQRLGTDLIRLDQEIRTDDARHGTDITGPYWMFGLIRLSRGRIEYLRGSETVAPPARFYGMFVPPYSVVEVTLNRSRSYSMGLVSATRLPKTLPSEPVLFIPSSQACPSSVQEMIAMIGASGDLIRVGRADAPSPLAVKVKNTIDRSYRTPRQLSEIAAELGISPAVMSRYFKKAYGLPPVHYRHHLRTMEAMMRLVEGRAIKDVYLDVGFDDLSRFYRHFRDHMVATPAKYRGV